MENLKSRFATEEECENLFSFIAVDMVNESLKPTNNLPDDGFKELREAINSTFLNYEELYDLTKKLTAFVVRTEYLYQHHSFKQRIIIYNRFCLDEESCMFNERYFTSDEEKFKDITNIDYLIEDPKQLN